MTEVGRSTMPQWCQFKGLSLACSTHIQILCNTASSLSAAQTPSRAQCSSLWSGANCIMLFLIRNRIRGPEPVCSSAVSSKGFLFPLLHVVGLGRKGGKISTERFFCPGCGVVTLHLVLSRIGVLASNSISRPSIWAILYLAQL